MEFIATPTVRKNFIFSFLALFMTFSVLAQVQQERVYANRVEASDDEYLLVVKAGYVEEADNAGDGDPRTYATLNSTTVDLLFVTVGGEATIRLRFPEDKLPDPGTPVTVKLGLGGDVLSILSGITIQPINGGATNNEGAGNEVGTPHTVKSLVDVLSGENQVEFTITPEVAYDGVKIKLGAPEGILSAGVLSTVNVYHAYYKQPATGPELACGPPIDLLFGTTGSIASGINAIENPYNAIDGNLATRAMLRANVSLLNSLHMTAILPSVAKAGDYARIVLANQGTGLIDLSLLTSDFYVKAYNGEDEVLHLTGGSSLLELRLLSGESEIQELIFPVDAAFDRIEIGFSSGLASALSGFYIYEFGSIAQSPTLVDDELIVCSQEEISLEIENALGSSTYTWYTDAMGGDAFHTGTTYSTDTLSAGAHEIYVSEIVSGCPDESSRAKITVEVLEFPDAPVLGDGTFEVVEGENATLEVSNPDADLTYNWYADADSQDILHTGDTYTIADVRENSSYYVEAVSESGCVGERSEVSLTVVQGLLPPTVAPPHATVSEGQGASFVASSENPGPVEYVWYLDGTEIFVGETFSTPTDLPIGEHTYEVTSRNPNTGAESAPTLVVVEVVAITGPGDCTSATAQTNGISGLCLLCSVQDPKNSVDGDPSNFTRLSVPVGVGASAYQTLIFPQAGTSLDSIRLDLAVPGGLADANLLGGIQVTVLNGDTEVNQLILDSGLLKLRLLSGNRFTATLPVDGAFDRVEIRNVGLATVLTSVDVYGARIVYPAPEVEASNLEICEGGTANLAVVPVDGSTYNWYTEATGGDAFHTGAEYSTDTLSAGPHEIYVSEIVSGCPDKSSRAKITVEVQELPGAPVLGDGTFEVVEGEDATLEVSNPGADLTYNWYADEESQDILHTGDTYTIADVTENSSYYVEAVSESGCVGERSEVSLTVVQGLLPPTVSPSVLTVTEGESGTYTASTDGNTNPNIEIVWEDESGNEVNIGETYNTDPDLSVDTYTYEVYVRDTVTDQTSESVSVTLHVVAPNTIGDCTVANAQSNGAYFLCLACGVEDPGNAVDGNGGTYSRFVAPASVTGGVWQELVFQNQGVAGDTITVKVGTGSSLLDLDVLSEITFESYNGTTANGDGTTAGGNLLELELLPGTNVGTIKFVAGASFDRVRIEYLPTIGLLNSGFRVYQADISYAGPSDLTQGLSVCFGETAILSATPSAGTELRWYDAATDGNLLSDEDSFATEALTVAGEVVYYLSVSRNGCEDPDRIPVIVNVGSAATPTTDNATQEFCASAQPTLVDLQVNEPNITWYDAATEGEVVPATEALADGTIYYASLTDAVTGCESSERLAVEVIINPTATAEDITAVDGVICGNGSFELTATSDIPGAIFTYYGDADLTNEIENLTVSPEATTTYYVTVSGEGVCENAPGDAATLVVTVNEGATPTTDEAVQNFCAGNLPTLADLQTNEANVIWYATAEGGTVLDMDTQLEDGTTYYAALNPQDGCESIVRLAVEVIINPTATAQDITVVDGVICGNGSFELTATSDIPGAIFTYYADADLTDEIEDLMVSPEATTTYYVTVSGEGVCENAPGDAATLVVTVNEGATPTTNEAVQNFCIGNMPTLADLQTNEANVIWYANAEGGTALELTTALEDGTTYYGALDPASGCESSVRLAVEVMLNPTATAQDITVVDGVICGNGSFELTATSDIPGAIFTYYADAELTNEIEDLVVSPETTTTYYVTVSGEGVCENAPGDAATLVVTVNEGATPTTDEAVQSFCAGNMPTVADLQTNEANVIWYATAEGGTALDMTTALEDGTTYYGALDPESGCESIVRLAVEVTINPSATAQDITVMDGAICGNGSFELTATSDIPGAIFTYYADADLTDEIEDLMVSPEATTTYYVTVSGEGVCENAPGDAATLVVTVNEGATPTTENPLQSFCAGNMPTLADLQTNEVNVIWYATAEGGAELDMTTTLEDGTTYYGILDVENGCESSERLAVEVMLNPTATAEDITAVDGVICGNGSFELTASSDIPGAIFTYYADADLTDEIENLMVSPETTTTYYVTVSGEGICENAPGDAAMLTVTVNEGATPTTDEAVQNFCAGNMPTVADLQTNEANVIWYATTEGGTALDLDTQLEDGTIYYGALDPASGCESSERLAVEVTINPSATAQDITVVDGAICGNASFELTATSNIPGAMFTYYADAELTNEIENLTISPETTTTYYVTVSGEGVCENAPGDAAALTVTVNEGATPTTDEAVQNFCAGNLPTVADLQTNEANVIWYATAEGGAELDMTTTLEDGTTYYGILDVENGCESSERLAVEVMLNPTATAEDITAVDGVICGNGSFELTASSDIPGAIFTYYADADLTDEIENLTVSPEATTTYYVTVSGEGICENAPGDAATLVVTVNEGSTPTTDEAVQSFCAGNMPTLAELQTNEKNVIWYATAEGGMALELTTALEDGTTYYGALDPASGCESSERLAVTIEISEESTTSIEGNAQVCRFDETTYTTDAGKIDYIWLIEGGDIVDGGALEDNFVTVSWNGTSDQNSVSVSYLDESSCSGEVFGTLDVEMGVCSDLTIAAVVSDPAPVIEDLVTFTISVTNEGDDVFENIIIRDQLPAGYSYESAEASIGTYDNLDGTWSITSLGAMETATLVITVKVLPMGDYLSIFSIESSLPSDTNMDNNTVEVSTDPLCLIIYNEFTPNNDGSNDSFKIDCIEQYPDNTLKIFNRFGNLVFEVSNYENDWDGTANQPTVRHDRLPAGTYFYVLELKEESKVRKGWLYIMR